MPDVVSFEKRSFQTLHYIKITNCKIKIFDFWILKKFQYMLFITGHLILISEQWVLIEFL